MPSPHLYQRPEIYAALRAPEPSLVAAAERLLHTTLFALPTSVFDPACGPGTWLLHFARAGARVAGSDVSPEMVAAARHRLAAYGAEIVPGDMRAIEFATRPFDAGMEVSGGISEMPDDRSLVLLLRAAGRNLRPGGAFLMVVSCVEPHDPNLSLYDGSIGPVEIGPGASGAVEYRVERHDRSARAITMRREVSLSGSTEHSGFVDRYALHTCSAAEFLRVLDAAEAFELVAAELVETGTALDPTSAWRNGEVLLALRRRS